MTKIYSLGTGKMEEINPLKKDLPFGSRVYSFGGGMSRHDWAVIGDGNRLVKMPPYGDGDYFSNPFKKLDRHVRPLTEKFRIGFYYDDVSPNFRYSNTQMVDAIKYANDYIKEQEAKKLEKQNSDEKERENLPNLYPHLTVNKGSEYRLTRKNIVAELKKHFPEIKFSIRKDGYDAVRISWMGGPSYDEVDKVVMKFEDHKTDFTGDFRDPAPSNFNKVFGGLKYIFTYCHDK